jgi:hypothetical protein
VGVEPEVMEKIKLEEFFPADAIAQVNVERI